MGSAQFRTRQAPSPTGFLHLGTARTVLFTKLLAVTEQGSWYLRLEDTDRARLQPETAKNLLESLAELGLLPDEGVTVTEIGEPDDFYGLYQVGDLGPYIQSERKTLYQKHAQSLLDKKLAYWSYLSPTEREELQQIKQSHKRPINYFKANQDRFSQTDMFAQVDTGLQDERHPALYYRLQRDQIINCQDKLLGKTSFDLSLEEDFIILKSDGFPAYHLAHLIDDHLMQTSLVIRGQEWMPSLAKHVAMYRDYWGAELDYLHLPVILAAQGNKKMSKRDGNVNMADYLKAGYLPEAILNYLAFLGWNPGTEKELYLSSSGF